MRNPEFCFVSTEPEEIVRSMTAEYERVCGVAVQPGSPEKLFIQWAASILVQERALLNYYANQNIPSRAEGENLEALAGLFFARERAGATAARCKVRFSVSAAQSSAVLIPAGTRVTDSSMTLYWATETEGLIPAGETSVELDVVCQSAGTEGNGWEAGQINTLVDLYDYCAGCENTTESGGGAEAETDEELYEAMRLSMDALSTAGGVGNYIYHAKRASADIADVVVNSPSAGEVRIYAVMNSGEAANESVKNLILAACNADDVRPMTDLVSVEDPEPVSYDIELTYYLPSGQSGSGEEIVDAIEAAVSEYEKWQSAKLGRAINPSVLIGNIMKAGAQRVEVTSPVYTALNTGILDPARSYQEADTVPQLAVVGDVTLTNGGYADG